MRLDLGSGRPSLDLPGSRHGARSALDRATLTKTLKITTTQNKQNNNSDRNKQTNTTQTYNTREQCVSLGARSEAQSEVRTLSPTPTIHTRFNHAASTGNYHVIDTKSRRSPLHTVPLYWRLMSTGIRPRKRKHAARFRTGLTSWGSDDRGLDQQPGQAN